MRRLNNGKWAVFTEKFLGPRWQTAAGEGHIPDVLAIRKSYTKPCIRILDVKVTEADFQRSIKEGKWSRYLQFCNQFYFAAPSGIITREALPDGVGWMVHTNKGWSTVQGAQYNPEGELSVEQLMSLIFVEQEYKQHVRDAEDRMRAMKNYRGSINRHRFADNIAQMLEHCEDAAEEHKLAASSLRQTKKSILEALGIQDQNDYSLRQAIQQRLSQGIDDDMAVVLARTGNLLLNVGKGLPIDRPAKLLKEAIEELQ
jgi:hypothetical protein